MMISQNYFTFPLYIPRIYSLYSNWPEYMVDYLVRRHPRLRKSGPAIYRMRGGTRMLDTSGTLAGTMAVVFVREEYGPIENFKTIVDVGANIGCFALYAAQRCPEAKIYCFEPEERNFNSLVRNVEMNRLDERIFVFQYAIASGGHQRVLAVTEESLRNSFHIIPPGASRQTTLCTTLNDIISSQNLEVIDLLKLNCEGAEYEILESCSSENLKNISNIRLEYHNIESPQRTGESLAKFLCDQGYRIQRFTRYLKSSGFIWATRACLGLKVLLGSMESLVT